jgi:hypothetical protein
MVVVHPEQQSAYNHKAADGGRRNCPAVNRHAKYLENDDAKRGIAENKDRTHHVTGLCCAFSSAAIRVSNPAIVAVRSGGAASGTPQPRSGR